MDSDCYVLPKPQLLDLSGQLNYWLELLRKELKLKLLYLRQPNIFPIFRL